MMEVIIDTRIKMVIMFHDIFHGFYLGIETGTSIMELNLTQDLVRVDQDPLFFVLLNLRKSYDNLSWGRLLNTLEGYGAGSKMRDILVEFWAW